MPDPCSTADLGGDDVGLHRAGLVDQEHRGAFCPATAGMVAAAAVLPVACQSPKWRSSTGTISFSVVSPTTTRVAILRAQGAGVAHQVIAGERGDRGLGAAAGARRGVRMPAPNTRPGTRAG